MARIEITSGIDSGRVVELAAGKHFVGRHPSSALQLPVDSVSGRHLQLTIGSDETVHFKDLGSTNGTFSAGATVTEGEWFPGSELKLGTINLKLLDKDESPSGPSASSTADDPDADLHARARQAALSGSRKGGPWMLILLVVLVVGAGGAAWFFYPGAEDESATAGAKDSANPGAQAVQLDLIEDLGEFHEDDAGAWSLPEGATIEGGSLRNSSGQKKASLVRDFEISSSSLIFEAKVSGGSAYAMVEWGSGEQETGVVWLTGDLAAGPTDLPLPESAEWFRLSILLQGSVSVSDLTVQPGEQQIQELTHEDRPFVAAGGNMVLKYRGRGDLLRARAAGGSWSAVPGGLQYEAQESGSSLLIQMAELTAEEGPFLILSDGGPVAAAPGVVVEQSPGLLIGGGARWFLVHFDSPAKVTARQGAASIQTDGTIRVQWDLSEALNQSSRLARRMENAAERGETATVLLASWELLRDWPLNDEKVAIALRLVRETIQEGRKRLTQLKREKDDATFLQSVEDLEILEKEARALAVTMVGTDLESLALTQADDLRQTVQDLRQSHDVAAAVYRNRLSTALSTTYPLLADWLRREEAL